MAKKFRELVEAMAPARRASIARGVDHLAVEMLLNEIRKSREVTQTRLADVLGITQARVSKIEEHGDMQMSTLRSYIEALGGTLEVVAHFPDGDVRVKDGGMHT